MGRPNLFALNTWASHESRVLEIFCRALSKLAAQKRLPTREDDLNRELFRFARKENYELIKKGRGSQSSLLYEANNQPAADDLVRAKRESKRPDFQCGFVDAQIGVDRFFVLEGKRLGQPSSNSWVLNENYITNGIQRFVHAEWAYGQDASSGVMIGYIQSMTMDEILEEVNNCGKSHKVPEIAAIVGGQNGLVQFQHRLDRSFPETPYRLIHVWANLRKRSSSRAIKVA